MRSLSHSDRGARGNRWSTSRRSFDALACIAAVLLLSGCGSQPDDPNPIASATIESPGPSASNRPGRVILFSMDTVRADRVGGYGTVETTPNLSKIAASGVRFRDFYAASSFTLPSTMSMLTGLDPLEHGIWNENAVLSDDVSTLAEVLRRSGYRTQGFHEGGYVAEKFGFGRGFDAYKSFAQRKVVVEGLWLLLDWMRSASNQPYFLFLHTYAAHDPYGGFERYRRESPERGLPNDDGLEELRRRYPRRPAGMLSHTSDVPAVTRELCTFINQMISNSERLACGYNILHPSFSKSRHFVRDREALLAGYDDRIRQIDRAIGKIRDQLVELGQWDDTLLVVTSDHGESFFEHGLYRHSNVPFNEVLKVPLLISYPNRFKDIEQHVVPGLAWHLDLLPTILALAGLPAIDSARGSDLTGVIMGDEVVPADRAVFPSVLRLPHEGPSPLRRVVIRGAFKFIEGHPYFGDPDGFLFDLNSSAQEQQNLREQMPEEFEALSGMGSDYASGLVIHPARDRDTGLPITAAPGEISGIAELEPEEEAALRALGYRE